MTQAEIVQRVSAQEFGRWVALAVLDREREEQRRTSPAVPDEAAQAQRLRALGFQVEVT